MKLSDQHSPEGSCIILIGNKTDIEEWSVTEEQGQALADQYNIPFFLTSAKTGSNITEAFTKMAQMLKVKVESDCNFNGKNLHGKSVKLQ